MCALCIDSSEGETVLSGGGVCVSVSTAGEVNWNSSLNPETATLLSAYSDLSLLFCDLTIHSAYAGATQRACHPASCTVVRQVGHEQGYCGFVLQYGRLSANHPVPLLGMWAALAGRVLLLGPHLSRGNGVVLSFGGSVSGDRISIEEKYVFLIHSHLPFSFWFASDATIAYKYFSVDVVSSRKV